MATFFKPMHDWFKKLDPTVAAALAGATKAVKTQTKKTFKNRRQLRAEAIANRKELKRQQKLKQQKIRDEIKRKHALRKEKLKQQNLLR